MTLLVEQKIQATKNLYVTNLTQTASPHSTSLNESITALLMLPFHLKISLMEHFTGHMKVARNCKLPYRV